ncbi:MAG: ABC transporter permease [Desulfomonilaceae bacterium]
MTKNEILELFQYRDLLWNLVHRDLTVRYKRSALGFGWTMLNPIIMTIVFSIVFATIFRFKVENFIIYFLSGYLFWNFFAQTTVASMKSILINRALLNKIYFPKKILVFSTVLAGIVNLGFALVPLGILVAVLGKNINASLLFVPVPLMLIIVFTIGVCLALAALAVFFNDTIDMYQVLLVPWLYMTPVIYPLEIIPPNYVFIIKLNPMYYMLECVRTPIYLGQFPSAENLLYGFVAAIAAFVIGYRLFSKYEDTFVYYV